MEFGITIGEEQPSSGGLTASLQRWLAADPELRGEVTFAPTSGAAAPGTMGGASLDVINVVVSNSLALGSLLVALAGWRSSRPRPPQITLERDGVVVTVHDASPETVEQVLARFGDVPDPVGSTADGDDV
ncbi:effector-associated constant component EACC1 [Streptomyces sp. MMS24-I2-30]|uniref:effector-associated constant component EACC1 n=1 Tax=Streptomyces sp. MMS24-I2-30 TaxID=3351564 RepID=UPI003896A835